MNADSPISLPPRLTSTLESYRQRVWIIKIAEGFLAGVFGLLISYLVVFCLDRLVDTSASFRIAILLVGSVGMFILFPLKCHNWVWGHRRLDQVARLLRLRFPRFGDHLLGIIELAQSDAHDGKSPVLIQAAINQVDHELEDRDLTEAVPNPKHRPWAWAAGVPLALAIALMLIIPAAGTNAFVRWLMPWKDVERYTFAQLEGESGARVVPYGEPFQVESRLKEDSPWKPATASARYGKQEAIVSEREGSAYRFEIPPQTTKGEFVVRVGDARRTLPVEPKMRPALSELTAEVQLPGYLERSEPLRQDVRGGSVSLVKGSTIVFSATATRELAEATLDDRPQTIEGAQITTERIEIEEPSQYRLEWQDGFGLTPREPQILKVDPREDSPPNVTFNKIVSQQVVLSNEVVAFEIQASDDFGVKRVGLEWVGIEDPARNPEPSSGEKIVAAGAPDADSLVVPATFSAEREKVRPQSLRLRVFAEDYLPNRERAYSPYLVLHVLTPADHFKWLTDQLAKWADASKEVYEKELQLNEANQELMSLPPEALDDPNNKKKIQEQAAAEMENAGKLSALIEVGKELVQEAVKNEEFDGEQLENLAEMLEKLEEIAGEKMPSVAGLLQQAAEAPPAQPGKPPEDPPFPGEPGEAKNSDKPNEEEPSDAPPAPPGGVDPGLEKAEKYGPKPKDIQGLDKDPEDPNKPGAGVNVERSEPPEGKPGYLPANPTPVVVDGESGFNKAEKAADAPQHKGGLLIPTTLLKGSGNEPEEGETPPPTTAELVLEAVTEQQDLLDAFAKLAGEMNKLLLGFENSTFVKRLKAASRRQLDLATELNGLDGFGLEKSENLDRAARKRISGSEVSESEKVFTIQEDMIAYADRKPSPNYSRVLDEMQNAEVVTEIREISTTIAANEVGHSTIEAEFWADTLDRWAEQLVDPLPPHTGPPPTGVIELPNLTPEIVLEVMRIIDGEIQLREETRELHQAVEGIEQDAYRKRGGELSETQAELARKARALLPEIEKLPMQDHPLMVKTIEKLTNAATVMDEVEGLLATPETGPPTIAAITEVIEILLETARLPNAPMVVKAPPANIPALMLVGMGDDGNKAFLENRAPAQATGKAGRELPEEFKQGLDAYLNALEGRTN